VRKNAHEEAGPAMKVAEKERVCGLVRLRYGINETDSWWHFAVGPHRQRIWTQLREMRTDIIRIFLYDKNAPNPNSDWPMFCSYVNAVLAVGAVPMVTFAKFPRPPDDRRAVRWFAEQCADVAWNCLEEWGEDRVRDWYWCVWNEPNSTWIGGGLSFEEYRDIYEHVVRSILRWLAPSLGQRRAPIGGPAVEGFDAFWQDWVYRLLTEVDPRLVGFVNWHRYADWRDAGEAGAPHDRSMQEALMLWRAEDYQDRARAVARLLPDPDVLNVCGEWNAHSHYLPNVRARFNQTYFGAAYGACALLNLIRGDVHAEMLWTGTDDACGYGVLNADGTPMPLYFARQLCAQYIRNGDRILSSRLEAGAPALDGMVVAGDGARLSAIFVHCEPRAASYELDALVPGSFDGERTLLKIDGSTGREVTIERCPGRLTFAGYGVAVVTNMVAGCHAGSAEDWV
jgi:Glycosyl hydrolases family 39